ncbi:hypothetical protein PY310_13485 [Pseudarthrobacter sp. H3Y2-7]|jgi:hypothetical protein|uniref:hypothetical protein n=1 Tax=Pseudarthrobacter naphthalenicus TaxID=3031328 RepID=UPI0023B1B318|nr:hypothetical protein [Pseudarthrobacter sp. H3Y2-7]MDE8669590.1 hypothetical protein [Pseudarthrobacter sp. H3Y2-7]
MSEDYGASIHDHGPHQHAHVAPTTQQMRTVGQRRRDAEEKLEHHLQEARHKEHHDETSEPGAGPEGRPVDSQDVAAIQDDDTLTAADRVDLIANQAVADDQGSPGNS